MAFSTVEPDEGTGEWYHRLSSPTQTVEVAEKQCRSLEIWGLTPRHGYVPTVQSYLGRLPQGAKGIEFKTDVRPDAGSPPGRASWRGDREDILLEGGYAKISVREINISY